MNLTDREGRTIPFFVDYFTYEDIRTADYSPTEDPSTDTNFLGVIESKGFLVRPDTDGALYGITLYDYINNGNSVTGLIPEKFLGLASTWIECRFVKIYAKNDALYASASDYINIGVTI